MSNEVALLRLVAQRIAGPGLASVSEVVRWMTALQAQDFPGVLTSIALRTVANSRAAVEAAFTAGEIVKSWPMRGTLHVVPAEDLPWLLELLTPRVIAGAAARRAQLDLDTAVFERARELAGDALTGGRQLRRDDLLAVWRAGGLVTDGQRGYHMLWHLAQTGTLCFGPIADGEQMIVLVDEWIPQPRHPERDEALGELARRYFQSHGPATAKDFARWANLVAVDVRTGLALAAPHLDRLSVDGVDYFLDPGTRDRLAAARSEASGVFLLPGFDEFILGYLDRSAMLRPEYASQIVPGGNGMFRPTVIDDGQVVGTWKHAGRGAKRTLTASPFEAFSDELAEAIQQRYVGLPGNAGQG
ncbi:winged helix DNA-binding domain-containing protein [Micromonospora sp. NPDC003197]